MTSATEDDDSRRSDAISRVEMERRDENNTEVALTLERLVEIVLGEGDWGAIVEWTEYALIQRPMITTDDLVDGILSLHDWSFSNA
ncbi:MAG: hypothetical protein CMJ29_13530 [Phycisphaerae bacterium]|nr:hypothetical protein [Phycisphaerae bacterium]